MRTVTLDPEAKFNPSPQGRSASPDDLLRLRPSILALASARLHSFHDAQDAAQETSLRVLRSLPSWRPTAPFEHWVFTIAANVIRDALRRRRTRSGNPPAPPPAPDTLAPDQALADGDDLDRVRRAIDALDPAEGVPLLLHLLHGLPQREIAAHLDIPVEHLRVRLYRAIRKVRRMLKE